MKQFRVLCVAVLGCVAVTYAGQTDAARLAGAWDGSLTVSGQTLAMRVIVTADGKRFSGTIDIPQQGASGLPFRSVTLTGANVRLELPTGPTITVFEGRLDGQSITGTFTQGPAGGKFSMARSAIAPPEAALVPYRQEELIVRNGAITLAGTLTMPEGEGPFPAIVLISGSGAQSRDEDIFGFKIFRDIADHLTRRGIAVYRYDDRGIGGSTGDITMSTSADFAGDVLAAIGALKTKTSIDARRIGLLGHSEGAIVASIAASRSADVSSLIFLGGPGVRGDVILRQQNADLSRAQGASEEAIARVLAAHQAVTAAVERNASQQELEGRVKDLVAAQYDALPAEQRSLLGPREPFVAANARPGTMQLGSPWMRFFITFDPAAPMRQIRVPVYAAFGSLDTQVAPSLNEKPMREALAGSPDVTVKVYEGANHLFQQAKSGLPTEYATLAPAFVPGLLDDLTAWLTKVLSH
jgi:pimeloyl-ACP methyl ester carboxylesterase